MSSTSDIQAPTLSNLDIRITEEEGELFIRGSALLNDDISGLTSLSISYRSVEAPSQTIELSKSFDGGNREEDFGLFKELNPFAASGLWEIDEINASDQAGNTISLNKKDFTEYVWLTQIANYGITTEAQRSFTINNENQDIQAPTLSNLDIRLTEEEGELFIRGSALLNDDISGLTSLSISYRSVEAPSQTIELSKSFDGGNREEDFGLFKELNPFAASGLWEIDEINASDQAGNTISLNKKDFTEDVWLTQIANYGITTEAQRSFTINNENQDIQAPTLSNLDIRLTEEEGEEGELFIRGSALLNDDISGLTSLSISYRSVEAPSQTIELSKSFDGGSREEDFGLFKELNPFAASGLWEIDEINASDQAGNTISLNKKDFTEDVWLTQIANYGITTEAQRSFTIGTTDQENNNGLIDNTPVYTLFNDGDPLTITKERSDGSTRTFSSTGIPNWDATQAVNAEDNSGNFYVLLEGADGTTREDQFKVWTTDKAGLISSETGWRSAEQLVQAGWEERFNIDFDGDELIGIPTTDEDQNGLVDNTSVYTLFNDGDPLTITKERSDGSTRNFSATGIPDWDVTQAVNAEDNSGNFYVLLEGADGTTREDQYKVWTTDKAGLISSETGWRSAEQLVQAGWEERFNIDFDGDELIGIPTTDEDQNGLVDNTSVYTLFNDGDPLTITKERSDGSTRNFSATGIPNWDVTQAVNAEDNSGNFYVLLEGADGTTREDQYKVWTTDKTASISSGTGWRSAEQLSDAWGEFFSILNSTDSTTTSISV